MCAVMRYRRPAAERKQERHSNNRPGESQGGASSPVITLLRHDVGIIANPSFGKCEAKRELAEMGVVFFSPVL